MPFNQDRPNNIFEYSNMSAVTENATSNFLDYTFPSEGANNSGVFDSKEHNLAKSLKLDLDMVSSPRLTSITLFKDFEDGDISEDSMFMELLKDHRKNVDEYQPSMTDLRTKKTTQTLASEKRQRFKDTTPRRSSSSSKKVYDSKSPSTSFHNTPIPNKTIFFSPSSSRKVSHSALQSTPVSMLKEAQLNKSKSNNNLLRNKLQSLQNSTHTKSQQKENEDGDELACHAGNIMRMAIDSTLLGSTLNSSYSLHFSHCNESLDITPSRKRFSDVFDDDDENEDSILESVLSKKRMSLKNQVPIRIDINDEELRAAISG